MPGSGSNFFHEGEGLFICGIDGPGPNCSRDCEGGNLCVTVGFENVGSHSGNIADIITDVVGDNSRVSRVVLGNTCFNLADEIGTDVRGLGKDSAPNPVEESNQRGSHGEALHDLGDFVMVFEKRE